MLSGSILIERQLKIMEIYSGGGNVKIHLELADNSVFVFKLFLRLLSSVEIKSLQPLRESFKLRLAFQLIGVNLQNNVRSQTSSNIKSQSPLPWAEPPWTWPSSSEPLDSAWLPKLFQIPSPSTSAQLRREQNKTNFATYDLEFLESMTESLIDYRKIQINDKNSLSDFFFFFSNFPSVNLPSPKFSVHTLSSRLALPSWEKNFRTSPEIRIFSLSHPPFPPKGKKLFNAEIPGKGRK